jgi:hypothetical protein
MGFVPSRSVAAMISADEVEMGFAATFFDESATKLEPEAEKLISVPRK